MQGERTAQLKLNDSGSSVWLAREERGESEWIRQWEWGRRRRQGRGSSYDDDFGRSSESCQPHLPIRRRPLLINGLQPKREREREKKETVTWLTEDV